MMIIFKHIYYLNFLQFFTKDYIKDYIKLVPLAKLSVFQHF